MVVIVIGRHTSSAYCILLLILERQGLSAHDMTDAQSKQSDQAMSNTNELMAELKKVTAKYEQVLKVCPGEFGGC